MQPKVRCFGRTLAATLLLAAVAAPWAPDAHAGLGDLVKSTKNTATQAATGQKPADSSMQPRKVTFDETMVEMTGPLLDKLLAARQKANAGLTERPALVKRQNDIKTEVDALNDKHGSAIWEAENKRGQHENCMKMALDEAKRKNWEAKAREMQANPASAQKIVELTAAMNDAQMKGDTATVNRLSKEAEKITAPTHADTVGALKQCGAVPPPHPAGVKIGQLTAELAQVDAKLRDMDAKALKLQAEACAMSETSIAMCWERIEMFCGGSGAFSEKELPALNERKAPLCAALKG